MPSPNDNKLHLLPLAGRGSSNWAVIQAARDLAPDHVRIGDFDPRAASPYDGGRSNSTQRWRDVS